MRLKTQRLEQLRDFFDRNRIGPILIGTPGFEKQLARYPQLYTPDRVCSPVPPARRERRLTGAGAVLDRLGLTFELGHPCDRGSRPTTPNKSTSHILRPVHCCGGAGCWTSPSQPRRGCRSS